MSNMWNTVKDFFHYSVTIAIARATAFAGFISAVVSAMDWSPLLGLNMETGFSKNQVIWLGLVAFTQGVAVEVARRRNLPK